MLCPGCGKEVDEAGTLCGFCGSSLSPGKLSSTESLSNASVAAPSGMPERRARRSGKALASFIFGLLPFVPVAMLLDLVFRTDYASLHPNLKFINIAATLLAVTLGHGAKAAIRRSGARLRGKGMAVAGLVLGYLWLAGFMLVILISAFIYHSRVLANQASTVGSLRTINSAAITYKSTYNHGYPPTLAVLGPPNAESPNSSVAPSDKAAGLIDDYLAASLKSNYRFTYSAGPADSTGKIQTYAIHANPMEPGVSGKLYYFTDQTNVIRCEKGRVANEHSPPIP